MRTLHNIRSPGEAEMTFEIVQCVLLLLLLTIQNTGLTALCARFMSLQLKAFLVMSRYLL